MKETIIALTITLAVALTIVSGIRLGQDWQTLNERAAALEQEVQARQDALDSLELYVAYLDQAVIRVDSEMSAREWLWIMADTFREAGVQVKFH